MICYFPTHIFKGEENHDLCCVYIFRPTISMGEENHDLCCVLFPNFLFAYPHFQWGRKIMICVAFISFPTHIFNGGRKS